MLCQTPTPKEALALWVFSEGGLNVHPARVPESSSGPILDLSVLLSRRISFWYCRVKPHARQPAVG